MRTLKSTTFLTPVVLALAPTALAFTPTGLAAQVTISTATTTPVSTSTVNAGSPADIVVASTGSITVNGPAAITVDSNNNVSNGGNIVEDNANGAIGIDVKAGTSSVVTNSGGIAITENFTGPNTDGNSVVDGPIAQATNRYGILVRSGGAHTGNILNTGAINIEGLNSGGINVADTLNGSLLTSGSITVRGDNSVGVQAGNVTGNVVIGGQTSVVGQGAVAVNLTGDVGGYVRFENNIGQKLSYTDDNAAVMSLPRAALRVGAPAVAISGNVAGGIVVAAAPTISTTNPDTDNDGLPDAQETIGVIQSYGTGAAMQIGNASRNITIGAVGGDTHGIVIAGSVLSTAAFTGTDTTSLQIGGLGGNVTVNGGISVSGRIQATTSDSSATALLINAGSSVPVLDNSGTILATISSPGQGTAYGIRDLSGTLTTINTNGFITAAGTAQDVTSAIDLSANTTGVTINQFTPTATTVTTVATPGTSITGNIITGSGNDLLTVSKGLIKGNTLFNGGNDTLTMTNDSIYQGNVDFGTGTATMSLANTAQFTGTPNFNNQAATLTLADTAIFKGGISGGANLAVNVNGGTLEAAGTSDLSFKSLNVASGGTLKVDIDTTTKTNPKFVVDTATFASGSHVAAAVNSLANAEGTYTVLTANTLTGMPDFSSDKTVLSYLFKGAVSLDATSKQVLLTIQRKTATELGLNRSEAAAYAAIVAAAPADAQVQQSILGIADQATLKAQFDELLPDHAGGSFDLLTRGSRAATRHITDNNSIYDISNVGGWLDVLKWDGSKDESETAAFKTPGFGISGGLERVTGIGNVGLSLSWISGKNENPLNLNSISINAYEFGAFWRVSRGPFYAFARAGLSLATFDGSRTFVGTDSAAASFGRTATAKWNGKLYTGSAGVSYQLDFGDRISLKPMAIIDYYRLHEDGYTETGAAATAGDAVDLTVAARTSDVTTAATTLTGIYRFGERTKEGIPLTIELEGGRRNMLGGALGNTTAHFVNGTDFTLTPDKLKGGWIGEARLLSGGLDYTWTLAASAEETQGSPAYSFRIGLSAAF